MAFELPQSRKPVRQIQIQKRQVPLEQIIAVQGQSPIAQGIDVAGNVIGQALQQRAALRKQGEELAALAAMSGQKPEVFAGLQPEMARSTAQTLIRHGLEEKEAASKLAAVSQEIANLEKIGGFQPGSLGTDLATARFLVSQANQNKRSEAVVGEREQSREIRSKGLEGTLRNQYIGQSKQFKDISEGYQRVIDSAKNPSPAGDLSMLFNYMKILDPTSVVRESEFAQAAATGSYGQKIQASVQRLLNGKRLTDEQRNDFLFQAKQLYIGQEAMHGQRESEFERLAVESGLDPKRVVFKLGNKQGGLQPLPMPGGAKKVGRFTVEVQP